MSARPRGRRRPAARPTRSGRRGPRVRRRDRGHRCPERLQQRFQRHTPAVVGRLDTGASSLRTNLVDRTTRCGRSCRNRTTTTGGQPIYVDVISPTLPDHRRISPVDAITQVPTPVNEPVRDYAPGSPERARLIAELDTTRDQPAGHPPGHRRRAPHRRRPGVRRGPAAPPRQGDRQLPRSHRRPTCADADRGLPAGRRRLAASCSFEDRASVFLRAADLLAGPWRERLAAATMLGQSKTAYQAEIDTPCELIDFWRFNVALRPADPRRPADLLPGGLEPGRVPAAGGLRLRDHPVQLLRDRRQPADRARADGQHRDLEGLPDPGRGRVPHHAAARGRRAAGRRDQPGPRRRPAGLRRRARPTRGSPASTSPARPPTFQTLWKQVGDNLSTYRTYPRLVGETGGKDFVVAHSSADPEVLTTALIRGAFDFQGQKCSAASRAFMPASVWARMGEDFLTKVSDAEVRRRDRPVQLRRCGDRPASLRPQRGRDRAGQGAPRA